MLIYQNNLIVYGSFDSIANVRASCIAKWNGTAWAALDTSTWHGTGISCAKEYKGDLYIGGNTWWDTLDRLARWDGTKWNAVGKGIVGGFAGVGSLEVYKDELYIAGAFKKADGNPGNALARWNGNQWVDLGDGMTSLNAAVYGLQLYDGYLYACGQFYTIGNLPIKGIAKWDGTEWCGLGQTTQPSHVITCMMEYNNDLYIGGGFETIDGDTVNYVAKWIGGSYTDICGAPSSISLLPESPYFSLSPNPAGNTLTIQTSANGPLMLSIYAIDGRLIKQLNNLQQANSSIDISELQSGIYFIAVSAKGQQAVKRFIKQ